MESRLRLQESMQLEIKQQLRKNAYIDVPCHNDVLNILKTQLVSDTYFKRGSGKATKEFEEVEAQHREWVKDIIDLSDFKFCYFTYGATDAIHHWQLTEKRPWQKLCAGEYEYPDFVGTPGKITCDVPGQNMDEQTGRCSLKGNIDPNNPLYVSVPSAADGNYFDISYIKAPVILDCMYISSTDKQRINVPKNTEQVFFSFSKGFGLVGERLGLVYTKEPHATLHLLKEFENWNYTGVRSMQLIMKNFAVDEMWNRYRDKQVQICKDYDITPSNCFYIATSRDKFWSRRRRMSWNDTARICITSLFDDYL